MTHKPTLKNKHILVTRPVGLAQGLLDEIKKCGGTTTFFPVIEIVEPSNTDKTRLLLENINDYDIALFISPTAVTEASNYIVLSSLSLKIGAIGEATTTALEDLGIVVEIKPDGHNSESLLKHALLQAGAIKNKHILIFKGDGGLPLLFDSLSSRGAKVFNANVYQRQQPANFTPLNATTLKNIDVILVSSGEGLTNLVSMTEDTNTLFTVPLIIPGNRCASIADALGFKSIIVADNATNNAFIKALLEMK